MQKPRIPINWGFFGVWGIPYRSQSVEQLWLGADERVPERLVRLTPFLTVIYGSGDEVSAATLLVDQIPKYLRRIRHTVEELQAFSNTRTPSPPWVHVVRLLVPMSCCDEAATLVIKALGGEEVTKRVVGGTKWWQVRGVKG